VILYPLFLTYVQIQRGCLVYKLFRGRCEGGWMRDAPQPTALYRLCCVLDVSVNSFLTKYIYNRCHIRTTFLIARSRVTNPCRHHYHHHHHHHLANMRQLLKRSGLTHPEVSFMVFPGFFCLLVCSFLVFPVIYYGTFCFYVATSFFYIPVFCPYLWLYWILFAISFLFYNASVFCCFSPIFRLCCCYSCFSCFNGPIFTTL
jgi:hypothetical protein